MKTKHSLLTSCISLLLCFVMLLGTTFAWFTDVSTSSGNVIQTGNLDIALMKGTPNGNGGWTWTENNGEAIFDYENWEPGYTTWAALAVQNNGSLAARWQAMLTLNGTPTRLADVIEVYSTYDHLFDSTSRPDFGDGTWNKMGTVRELLDNDGMLISGNFIEPGHRQPIVIALHMREDANNDYQNMDLGANFDIKIIATQASFENDSFGNDYDKDAQWPGTTGFETTASLNQVQTIYGELANDFIIRYSDSVYALLPAGTKLQNGVGSLKFSGKSVENGSNITLGDGDSAQSYDIHIEGIAEDNTKPITVYLGAIFDKNISDTSLKLYHEDALMTRVNSTADFAINNQYTYDPATGDVVIYVDNFSVFSSILTNADKWDGTSDTSWYIENETEFTLTTAEQFAGFRDLVDGGNTFAGKTVKLGVDINLADKCFDPIGFGYWNESKVDANGNDKNTVFMGTFDGGNHTIYNLYENCWELDTPENNYSTYTYSTAGAGLFASIKDATIKNLAINGAEVVFECVDMGVLVGYAQGECHFENIVVTDAKIANYNRYTGGLVGEVSYGVDTDDDGFSHTFKNITIDSTVTVSGLWGSFGCGMGGVIGGKWGDATVKMENVVSAPVMDVYNDVVSAYQWYAFRGCGMLIGHTEEPYSDGRHSGNATANFLKCENVKVYYGDWVNYHYYEFENQDNTTGQRYPWVRAEAGEYCDAFSNIRYGVPTHDGVKVSDLTEEELKAVATDYTPIVFDQLYGADRGMYGTANHDGVAVFKKNVKTVYIHNNASWTNLKLDYWYKNGEDTWTNLSEGIDMSEMLLENDIYKIEVPIYANGFKISADDSNEREFVVGDVANNGFYTLVGEHTHEFDANGDCICGCKKVIVNIADYADANNWVNGTKYINFDLNTDISITASEHGNNAKYYISGENWRIYQTDSGTFTINSANGNILSVKITYASENTGILTFNGATVESETEVEINATSATFGIGNTEVAGNGQARITEIEVIYSTVLACAHKQTVTETKTPTCTEAGYTATRCADCGKVLTSIAGDPATGHNYNGTVTKEATCTEEGLTTYKCSKCDSSYTEKITAKGHSYGEGEVTTEATCTTAGEKTYTCTICDDTKIETIDVLGHSYTNGTCANCGEAEPAETPETPAWTLVTDVSDLKAGDKIVIVAKDYNFALSTTQNNNNRGQATVTKVDDTITFGDDVQIITLEVGTKSGTYAFNTGSGYLYAASSGSNYLRTETTLSDNSSWKITIADGTATIVAQGASSRNTMQYNQTSSLFSCYSSASQKAIAIYKLVGDSGNEGGETPCEHTNTTETTTATCTTTGVTTVVCDDCGVTVSTTPIEALGHEFINGECSREGCDAKDPNAGGTTEPTVVLEITKDDFNSTSYAANNNTKTEGDYSYTSYQVMNQSSAMQWQKSKGYITIASNVFDKLELKVSAGTYTVTVGGKTVTGTTSNGVTTYDLSGLTGEVKIAVGGATGKVEYLKFYK